MPNRFTPIQPGTDPNQQLAIINKNFGELDNESVKKLYDDTTGTHRILIDGATGAIKVARAGFDVTTATDAQLAYNSAQNVLKVANTVTGSLAISFAARAAPGSDGTFRDLSTNTLPMPHGLGYVPAISPFFYDPTSLVYVPAANGSLLTGPSWSATNPVVVFQGTTAGSMATMYLLISVDATNVTIQGVRSGWQRSGVTVPSSILPSIEFKVYCLQETAS